MSEVLLIVIPFGKMKPLQKARSDFWLQVLITHLFFFLPAHKEGDVKQP